MKDIADPKLVDEVVTRIQKLEIDDPLESGYIEQLIEENVMSPFQQVQNTERPDRVIGALLEGRVAILLDGTPYALIVPVTFSICRSRRKITTRDGSRDPLSAYCVFSPPCWRFWLRHSTFRLFHFIPG